MNLCVNQKQKVKIYDIMNSESCTLFTKNYYFWTIPGQIKFILPIELSFKDDELKRSKR